MWRRSFLLGALALGVLAAPSYATIADEPVTVRMVGERLLVEPGRPVRLALEIRARHTVEVADFALEGGNWSGSFVTARPQRFAVTGGVPARVEIDVRAVDSRKPLVLRWQVDGRTYRQPLDLSPAAAERHRRSGAVRSVKLDPRIASAKAVPPARQSAPYELQVTSPQAGLEPFRGATPARAQTGRMVRVTGAFVYDRDDSKQMGADGVTVAIYEKNYGNFGDWQLASGVTDPFGRFDLTFFWDGLVEAEPDIYLVFIAGTAEALIHEDGYAVPYGWGAGPWWDFTGDHLEVGGLTPAGELDHAALNVLTDINRDLRWYVTRHGIDLPAIELIYPATHRTDISHYNADEQSIAILETDSWNESTHGHELGHHFMYHRLPYIQPDYCNGICDIPECGHCMWCAEGSQSVGWSEGLPHFMSLVQTDTYESDYGLAPLNSRSEEYIGKCWPLGGILADPPYDEGHCMALLQDVYDTNQDTDTQGIENGRDALALGEAPIFDAIFTYAPVTLMGFISSFMVRYPQYKEELWATCANNRIDIDTQPPGAPTNLRSSTHTAGVASPDATPTFIWSPATDDASGVQGYSIRIGTSAQPPDSTMETADGAGWTSPPLAPGRYWITMRALDWAGRWSGSYATWGEIVIRDALHANLLPYAYPGWDDTLVPRAAGDALFNNVAAPAVPLPGGAAQTWWNACARNSGEASTGLNWLMQAYVDGLPAGAVAFPATGAGITAFALNRGPITVPGGRHTFAVHLDDDDEIAETIETDNEHGQQWIWLPPTLAVSGSVTCAAPPDRTGGWEDIPAGEQKWFNVDGLRIGTDTEAAWRVVWMRVDDPAVDYDCRLHRATALADTGFAYAWAYSQRPEGCLDAVLVNHAATGAVATWDVGVINASGGSAGYYAKHVVASSISEDDSVNISFPAGEMLRLREFTIAAADTGWFRVSCRIKSGSGPVYLAWYDAALQTGALLDHSALATAADSGDVAGLDLHMWRKGVHGLAIYRDPKDGTAALTVVFEFERMPPDYEPYAAAGWAAPLVPRPTADGTPTSVAAPDTLVGDAAATYLNFAMWNSSPGVQASGVGDLICLDGVPRWSLTHSPPGGYASAFSNLPIARTIAGGRHTLSMRIDPSSLLEEVHEDDNGFGRQWVWAPATLSTTSPLTRAAPPEAAGGWDEVTSAPYGLWYDCDGLRVASWAPSGHHGYWGAFAVMPGDTCDVDVRLHEAGAGAQTGFRSNLVRSNWGTGLSDYCLVNFNLTPFRAFDLGVLRVGEGTQAYTAQAIKSVFRGTNPDGVLGPYTMPGNVMIHLHEFWLDPGSWSVTVSNSSGSVDWGFGVHDGARTYASKSTTMDGGLGCAFGAGVAENAIVRVTTGGYHSVAVWKTGSADLPLVGAYLLEVTPTLVDAPGPASRARTAFAAAYPNPFTRGTRLVFDLARPCEVSLEVYDLLGTRVRTLAAQRMAAGRHELTWDGRGATGRPVAAGVYFARFAADGVAAVRRVVKFD